MAATVLDGLKRQRPEWAPWLAVVEEVMREVGTPAWDAAVPAGVQAKAGVPLLDGARIPLQAQRVRRLFQRLSRIAACGGTPKMATLSAAVDARVEEVELFRASLCHDADRVREIASECGADAEAFQAVAALVAVPFLQACRGRFATSVPGNWVEGYCPVCASWPAFVEVRGIERSRHFRCGRCGGDWHARALTCPYCTMRDHEALVSLVPGGDGGSSGVIEACTACMGYVKTFTKLQGCQPGEVMLEDLGSVSLDVAAIEQGYTRPQGIGCLLDLTIVEQAPSRRFFAWNA